MTNWELVLLTRVLCHGDIFITINFKWINRDFHRCSNKTSLSIFSRRSMHIIITQSVNPSGMPIIIMIYHNSTNIWVFNKFGVCIHSKPTHKLYWTRHSCTIANKVHVSVNWMKNLHKNIVRHTAHTIVSCPYPKQWLMIHTSGLMMIIR